MSGHLDWFANLDIDELVFHPNQQDLTSTSGISFAEFMRRRARTGHCGRCIGGPLDGQERCGQGEFVWTGDTGSAARYRPAILLTSDGNGSDERVWVFMGSEP